MKDESTSGDGIAGVLPVIKPLSESARAMMLALRDIAFGEIDVVIHNARVIQITRSQKFRFGER
jgi:hypothetical protein